jgi:prefoldin alpha subunit
MSDSPQNRSQALKHYETKVDFIRTNLETLQDTIQKKQDNLNYLLSIIQSKLQAQTQAA